MAKKTFIKSMILVIMVALASVVANAQAVITTINARDTKACGEYLQNNLTDTIVNIYNIDGGKITRRVYVQGTKLCITNDTILYKSVSIPSEVLLSADTVAVKSRVQLLVRGGQPQDVKYGFNPELKALRDSLNGDSSDADAGKVALNACNKYGVSFGGHAGASFAKGVMGLIFGVDMSYDRAWGGVYLNGEIGKTKYSENAVNAGEEYWTYRTEAGLMFRPFKLDSNDQNRLFVLGGLGFEHYKTNSQPIEMADGQVSYLTSEGNYLYATAGLAYEYRFFGTGNTLGARLQWRNTRATVQNSGDEIFGSWALSVYFKFGVHRNKMITK